MHWHLTWNKPGSVFFGWFGRFEVQFWRMILGSGCSRFRIFMFVAISNGKFTNFLIFYEVRTFGLAQGLIFFGRFEVRYQRTNPCSEGLWFGFLKVREVRGSVFSGSFQN